MDENMTSFELPGFRFKPTEEELLSFYLKNIVYEKKMHLDIIGLLNIYHYDPWDLPGLAKIGEREWYFFVPRDRKPNNGGKPNRTTEHGFWKATGSDRKIVSLLEPRRVIGLRKTLVFYKGRAPRGSKTDWVMNEYRLSDNCATQKDIVLCKVYRKATSLKELEQRAAKEEAILEKSSIIIPSYPTSPISSSNGTTSYSGDDFGQLDDLLLPPMFMSKNDHNNTTLKREEVFFDVNGATFEPRSFISDTSFLTSTPESEEKFEEISMSSDKKEEGFFDVIGTTFESTTIISNTSFLTSTPETEKFEDIAMSSNNSCNVGVSNTIQLPFGKGVLGELQVPKLGLDWAQDPFSSQSCSPWLENLLINFSSPTLISQFL